MNEKEEVQLSRIHEMKYEGMEQLLTRKLIIETMGILIQEMDAMILDL